MLFIGHIGMWLSLVEHYVRDVGAAGSNPVIPTKNGKQIALLCGLFFLLPNVSRNNTESEVIKESVLNKYPPAIPGDIYYSPKCLIILLYICLKNNNDNVNEAISAMLNDHQTAWIPPNFARIYADGRSMIS